MREMVSFDPKGEVGVSFLHPPEQAQTLRPIFYACNSFPIGYRNVNRDWIST